MRVERKSVWNKYNGLCAYSGTKLEDDWQVDHIHPKHLYDKWIYKGDPNAFDNLVPAQKLINHYKGGMDMEEFRQFLLTMHKRLAKLPKNPRTERSKRHKEYLNKIAGYFNITPERPFSGVFYFEKEE